MQNDPAFAVFVNDCFTRHLNGDWGCVMEEDRESNEAALKESDRLLSSYIIDPSKEKQGNTLWIITEADRSVTTALYPHEY